MLDFQIDYGKFKPLIQNEKEFHAKLISVLRWSYPSSQVSMLPCYITSKTKVLLVIDMMEKYQGSIACIYHVKFILPPQYDWLIAKKYNFLFKAELLTRTIGLIYCGVKNYTSYSEITINQYITPKQRHGIQNVIKKFSHPSEKIDEYILWKNKFLQSAFPICEQYLYQSLGN